MKWNQTSPVPVRLHAQIYWFHDPLPLATYCLLSLSLSIFPSISLPPSPFSTPKFNLVFASDGEKLCGFILGAVEYIKLQVKKKKKEINKEWDLSVLVSLHWMSMICSGLLFYLLIYSFFPPNAMRFSVQFVAEYWYWCPGLVWMLMVEGSPRCRVKEEDFRLCNAVVAASLINTVTCCGDCPVCDDLRKLLLHQVSQWRWMFVGQVKEEFIRLI